MSFSPIDKNVLRGTATSMREHHPVGHPRHDMWFRLATLMELAANEPEVNTPIAQYALLVAEAYTAAIGRPVREQGQAMTYLKPHQDRTHEEERR